MIAPYYDHGGITIYHGDCREILPSLEAATTLVSDPPYEIRSKFGSALSLANGGTRRMQFAFDVDGVTEEVVLPALRLAFRTPASFHLFCGCEQFGPIAELATAAGFTPKPWARIKRCPPPPMPGNWWPNGFELAVYGYKPGAYFGDANPARSNIYVADGYRHGVRAAEKTAHPTQKWLPMVAHLVGSLCSPEGVVLDPFMGSGTTLRAAKDLQRRAIGIDIDERYCEIAAKRLSQEVIPGMEALP